MPPTSHPTLLHAPMRTWRSWGHWLLLAGLSLGSATALMAQTAPNPQGPANGNKNMQLDSAGKTTSPQAAQQLSFQRADANNDGRLSREEAQNLPAIAQQFSDWDRDGDGHISEQEYLQPADRGKTR